MEQIFIFNNEQESMEVDENEEEKLKQLSAMIIDHLMEENWNKWHDYESNVPLSCGKSLNSGREWLQQEGLNLLLSEKLFELLVNRKMFLKDWFLSTFFTHRSISEPKVQQSLMLLLVLVSKQRNSSPTIQSNSSTHETLCDLLLRFLQADIFNELPTEIFVASLRYANKICLAHQFVLEYLDYRMYNNELLYKLLTQLLINSTIRLLVCKCVELEGCELLYLTLRKCLKMFAQLCDQPSLDLSALIHEPKKCQRFIASVSVKWCLNAVPNEDEMVQVDSNSTFILGPDRMSAIRIHQSNHFIPVRSAFACPPAGCYYYEAIPLTEGSMAIGWCTRNCRVRLGADHCSIGLVFNQKQYERMVIVHDDYICSKLKKLHREAFRGQMVGCVVGCLIDLDWKQFTFYINGVELEITCHPLKIHYSSSSYYAAASLSAHQNCYFNFGQTEFRYPPKDVQFQSFHQASNGDLRRYQLVETMLNSKDDFWWAQPILQPGNRFEPFFTGKTQLACDQAISKLADEILDHSAQIILKPWKSLNSFSFPQVTQSLIEIIGSRCSIEDKIDLVAYIIGEFCLTTESYDEPKTYELLHPYLNMQIQTHHDRNKCRIVCIVLLNAIRRFQQILQSNYREIFNFLLHSLTQSNDEWTMLYALLTLDELIHQKNEFWSAMLEHDGEVDEMKLLVEKSRKEFQSNKQVIELIDKWRLSKSNPHKSLATQNVQYQLHLVCSALYQKLFAQHHESHPPSKKKDTLDPGDATSHLKMSPNCLSARSDFHQAWNWSWESARSMCSAREEVFYFEAILLTSGPMSIGWATKRTELTSASVGTDMFSVGINGFDRMISHDTKHKGKPEHSNQIEARWKAGDVVGCLIDVTQKKFRFYLEYRIVELDSADHYFSNHPYYAAISLPCHQQVLLNFGQFAFKYEPQLERIDYWSFSSYLAEHIEQVSVVFSNNKVKNSVVLINSVNKSGSITIKRAHCSPPPGSPSIEGSSTSNSLINKSAKRQRTSCSLCQCPTSTQRLRFECCEIVKLCLKCAAQFKDCPLHSQQNRESTNCLICARTAQTARFQFECCDQFKLCSSCIYVMSNCPMHK